MQFEKFLDKKGILFVIPKSKKHHDQTFPNMDYIMFSVKMTRELRCYGAFLFYEISKFHMDY